MQRAGAQTTMLVMGAMRCRIVVSILVAGCGASTPIQTPRDASPKDATSERADVAVEEPRADAASETPLVDAMSETPLVDAVGDATSLASADGAGMDADACGLPLAIAFTWTITAKGTNATFTCAQDTANAVYLIVDGRTFKFPCTDGAGLVPGLEPGVHALTFELVRGASLGPPPTPSGKPNPTSCLNDIDCVATPGCGGDVCDYDTGFPHCVPAGTAPRGTDGWCTKDADCKCASAGARCNGIYCSFTKSEETVLSTLALPPQDLGCGTFDLGDVLLLGS